MNTSTGSREEDHPRNFRRVALFFSSCANFYLYFHPSEFFSFETIITPWILLFRVIEWISSSSGEFHTNSYEVDYTNHRESPVPEWDTGKKGRNQPLSLISLISSWCSFLSHFPCSNSSWLISQKKKHWQTGCWTLFRLFSSRPFSYG